MLWHIYPQDEEVHITKLNAFLDRYTDQTTPALKAALRQSWLAWNQEGDMGEAWHLLIKQLNDWQQHSRHWCDSLLEQADLASQLVDFCTSQPSQKSTTEKQQRTV